MKNNKKRSKREIKLTSYYDHLTMDLFYYFRRCTFLPQVGAKPNSIQGIKRLLEPLLTIIWFLG